MKYDVVVIGAGPAGYTAAIRCSESGKKVLLVENSNLGGVCTNEGCIPTKTLLNCAKTFSHAKNGEKFGVHCNPEFCICEAMALKSETIETLRNGIALQLKNAGVEVAFAVARCMDNHHVCVGDEAVETDYIILATGSSPTKINIPGVNLANVVTSCALLSLENLPDSLAIIGGGVIGIEFASLFSLLGVKITVIEMLDEILPMLDAECAKVVRREMKEVDFSLSSKVVEIREDGVLYVDAKGRECFANADLVLMATGRSPNTDAFEDLHLEMNGRYVKVDSEMKTSFDNVYAIGDVNGISMLAHSASEMACVASSSIAGIKTRFDSVNVPWAVYSAPECAGCGLTEKKARELGHDVKTSTVLMRSNGRFLAENGKKAGGLVKVIADSDGKLLGVHIVGTYASEIIWGVANAVSEGRKAQEVASMVFPHPSVSETIKAACEKI